MTANAVVAQGRAFNDDALASIGSFNDAIAALKDAGFVPDSIVDYGNGFSVLDNKERLVNNPFMVLEWRFNESDMSDEPFASLTVVTKGGEKLIVNDGSSGIRAQLQSITRRREQAGHPHPQAALMCPTGLTVSRYMYVDEKGEERPAATYYLSESA